jgi:hypothetical protein
VFLTGNAGIGKTFALSLLYHHLRRTEDGLVVWINLFRTPTLSPEEIAPYLPKQESTHKRQRYRPKLFPESSNNLKPIKAAQGKGTGAFSETRKRIYLQNQRSCNKITPSPAIASLPNNL